MRFPAFLYDLGEQKSYYSSRNFQNIMRRLGLSQNELWNPQREHTRHTLCDYLSMVRLRLIEAAEPDTPRVSWVLMPIHMNDAVQACFVVMESREFLDYYDEYSIRIAFLLLQSVYEQIAAARSVGDVGFENFALFVCNAAPEGAPTRVKTTRRSRRPSPPPSGNAARPWTSYSPSRARRRDFGA